MSVAERDLWTKTLPHLVVPEVLACASFLAAQHATGIYRSFFWIVSGLAGMVFACRYSAWLWRAWTVGDR